MAHAQQALPGLRGHIRRQRRSEQANQIRRGDATGHGLRFSRHGAPIGGTVQCAHPPLQAGHGDEGASGQALHQGLAGGALVAAVERLAAMGTAISIVAYMKNSWPVTGMPVVNMWCAHTTKDRMAMEPVAYTMEA